MAVAVNCGMLYDKENPYSLQQGGARELASQLEYVGVASGLNMQVSRSDAETAKDGRDIFTAG